MDKPFRPFTADFDPPRHPAAGGHIHVARPDESALVAELIRQSFQPVA
jgi:hypothetical protein